MGQFDGFDAEQEREFASRWLPAWTGGDPERLLAFYSEDAFYSDPAVPGGLRGQEALRDYFTKLLARYPDWIWTQTASTSLENGFLNRWHAEIPGDGETIAFDGVCTVQLRDGLIERNEVFFDPSPLLRAAGAA